MTLLKSAGMDFVASHSEGYCVWDLDGREFLDLDLRAGVYNLGHRNPRVTEALQGALRSSDMGFALFPGEHQTALAEKLAASSGLDNVLFAPSGTEANDLAIQVARRHTGNRRILSCASGYHGAAGLASAAGNPEFSQNFNSDYPDEFATFPAGDLDSLRDELRRGDVAAVLIEPACNAAGYPTVPEGFWTEVQSTCAEHGALLIMDEIVTGLGRSGHVWGFQKVGVTPDIAVTAKGLSGGIYPIAAVLMSAESAQWLHQDFAGYAGTFAGGELACVVGSAAFDLSTSRETLENVHAAADHFADGLEAIRSRHSALKDIRQFGILFGLEFDLDGAGFAMVQALFRNGVLAFPAAHANRVVNLKPGLLVDEAFCSDALQRVEDAVKTL
ncbi:MAG: aminotransferase class III-fold pyridoxal phosphate-dependent enzyme [Myxococcota bacterium]